MDTLTAKIKHLGGVRFLESLDPEPTEALAYIEKVMGAIPERRTLDFISKFGNSRFKKDVFARSVNKSAFLQSGDIAIGTLFGWGTSRNSILSIIQRYHCADQVNLNFLPLFEGYPGDIICYSLEEKSLGKIYYWHHESDIHVGQVCVADSLPDFVSAFFVREEHIIGEGALSDNELNRINDKRRKVGLHLIDRFKNPI